MSALTDQFISVHAALTTVQNTALDIASAENEGNALSREARCAVFEELQAAQLADLDAKLQALQLLLAPPA